MTATVARTPIARRRLPAQLGRWPSSRIHRWGLRVGLGVPFLVIAIVADVRGFTNSANQALATASGSITWGSSDLDFVADTYPPIPTALAAVVPNSALWTALLGALCAGIVLQLLWERLRTRQVAAPLIALLLAASALIPPFIYASTQNLAAFLGLALFTIALSGLVRFAVDGDTEGGFQCGLALGVAAMCDPATLVVALCLGAAAPLIAWRRYRGQAGAVTATLIIITFPTVAALAGWAFLEWRFTGSAFHTLRASPEFLAFPDGFLATLGRELVALVRRLVITPLFVVAAALILLRRPLAGTAQALVLLTILVTQLVGINYAVGQGVLLLTAIAVMTVERAPNLRTRLVLAIACVAQLVLQWSLIRPNTPVHDFVQQVMS